MGRNRGMAIVIGMNQLSSEAYGSFARGPDVRWNFLLLFLTPSHLCPLHSPSWEVEVNL